jgi:predicted PurR-regulated permease PerM
VKLKAVEKSSAPDTAESVPKAAVEPSAPAARHGEPPTTTPSLTQDPQAIPMGVRSSALAMLAVIAGLFLLQYAQAMIIPVVLGILISYALEPPVDRLTRLRLPRPVAAGLVLITLTAATGALVYSLRTQASDIVQQLPDAARRLRRIVNDGKPATPSAIEQVQKAASELEKAATAAPAPPPRNGVQRVQVENPPININQYVMYGSLSVVAAAGQAVLILFLVFFLLASGDLYRRKIVKIAGPSLSEKKVTVEILREIDLQIEAFLTVQLFTSTLVAVATWLAFLALGVQQAAVWGVMAGIFNSIPYFGPVLVSGGAAIIAFLQFGTIEMALLVSAVAMVITSLEGFLLTPMLMSRAARMNAVAVFVGLLFFGWLWNVWGMLLAVPMLMVLKTVCDHVEDLQSVGELLGE